MKSAFLILFALMVSRPISFIEVHALIDGEHSFSLLGEWDNGYSEDRFDQVLSIVQQVYQPIISAKGGELRFRVDWTDGAVNMWAWRSGQEYWLEIPGGMARYHLINEEGFIQSICHELGHLLGGVPATEGISYEGQADYSASLVCMKLLLPQIQPLMELPINKEVGAICAELTHLETSVCHRSLIGALSLTSYYASLEGANFPKFSTPSPDKVKRTMVKHPPAQCRLDTLLAGTVCNVDPETGTSCKAGTHGARPACWFKE